MIFRLIQMK